MMISLWSLFSEPDGSRTPQVDLDIVEAEKAMPSPIEEQTAREQQKKEQQKELLELQQRLAAEKVKLESQNRSLQNLKARQSNVEEGARRAYTSQIDRRDSEIQNLLDTISLYRDAEERINREATEALSNQDNIARVQRERLDASIQQQEQTLQNLENELNYVANFPGLDVFQARARAEQLRSEVETARDQLNNLRAQRVDISASVFGNSGQIQSLAEQARQELRDTVQDTQERIFSLRSEIGQLQGAQLQSLQNAEVLDSQISRAEKVVQDQTQQVQLLEQEVQRKEREIRRE